MEQRIKDIIQFMIHQVYFQGMICEMAEQQGDISKARRAATKREALKTGIMNLIEKNT